MGRLIDADALLREHCGALFYGEYTSCEECQADGHPCGLELRAEYVKNALTVDAVEVTRCKDCIEFAGEGMFCGRNILTHYDHFYCYYGDKGERETE